MLKVRLVGQTKISQRGYIEVRSLVWNLLPVAIILGACATRLKRARYGAGGLVLEFLAYMDKVLDYQYEPAHGHNRGARGRRNPIHRELAHALGVRFGSGGSHRRLVV